MIPQYIYGHWTSQFININEFVYILISILINIYTDIIVVLMYPYTQQVIYLYYGCHFNKIINMDMLICPGLGLS
jgi:hypothetical protein